jgi:hypothetical protein
MEIYRVRELKVSKMAQVQVLDSFGKINVQTLFQKMRLEDVLSKEQTKRRVLTIDALKATARWAVQIVAIWTVQFYGIHAWHIVPSARHNVGSHTVDAWTRAEYIALVFIVLLNIVRKEDRL